MCKKPAFLHKAQNYNFHSVFAFPRRALPAIRSVSRSVSSMSLQLKILIKIKLKKEKAEGKLKKAFHEKSEYVK